MIPEKVKRIRYSLFATRCFLLATCCSLLSIPASGQWWKGKSPDQVNLFSVGFAADAAFTLHNGDFTLPYAPTCCTSYTTSTSIGPSLSLFIRQEFSKSVRATLRVSYSPYNGTFTTRQDILVTNSTPGVTEHTLETDMTFVGGELLSDIQVAGPLRVMLGLSAGAMTGATYSQKETLITPGTGTFENGRRVRNETNNADLQNMANPVLGLVGGFGYDIPVEQNHSIIITPELLYTYGINNLVEGTSWKANQLRVGVSIAFALNAPEPPLPVQFRRVEYADSIMANVSPDQQYSRQRGVDRIEKDTIVQNDTVTITDRAYRTDTVFTPLRPELSADITAAALNDDGSQNSVFTVKVSTQFVTEALPLLPVVFFESQAISLSFRYHQITEPRQFNVDSIQSRTTAVHREVLNIIGSRLRQRTSSTIKLIGTADPTTESADCSLAENRAQAVKKYLVEVWGIDGARIDVARGSGSCAPKRTTREQSEAGYSENRRVEIETSDLELLAPVAQRRFNEARSVNPPVIVLDPKGTVSRDPINNSPNAKYITSWSLEGTSGKRTLFSQQGQGVPGVMRQELTPSTADLIGDKDSVVVRLSVNGIQNTFASATTKLDVKKDTLKTELERLTLTLFDVSSDEISPVAEEQIKRFVENVPKGAKVIVRGYADMLGNAEFNRKLSQQRAQSVCATIKKYLTKQVDLDCTEVATDRYPPGISSYATPEERFLSRTVQIEVKR